MLQDEIKEFRETLHEALKDPEKFSQFLKEIIERQKEMIEIIGLLEAYNEATYLNYVLLKKRDVVKALIYVDGKVKSILDVVNNVINGLFEYKKAEDKIKKNIENTLRDYKEYLEDANEVLHGYYIESKYVNEVISDKLRDSFSAEVIDEEFFYESVFNFVNEVEEEKEERIKEILTSLPFAMSRKRFYDYLQKALKREYANYEIFLASLINIEENFYGKLVDGYGEIFPSIAQKIERLQALDVKSFSEEEAGVYFDESSDLLKVIHLLKELIFSLLRLINRLLIVFSREEDIEKLIKKEPFINKYVEFYGKLLNNDVKNSREIEKNVKKCDSVISNWYFELYRYNSLLSEMESEESKLIEVVDESIIERVEILAEYENLLNDASEIVIEADRFGEDPVDDLVIKTEIKNVIDFIENLSKKMTNEYRKVRLKRLMGIVPLPVEFEKEFLYYVRNALELNNSYNRKLSYMHTIKKKMDLYRELKKQKDFYEGLMKNSKDVI
ncbi:hypothetical protein [Caldanaerobacter sp.]|uniref:hypothetical protein n=1 Tax=Caldanaerobacter sp. TaxID=2930036 RepID=UPI003C77EAB5